MRFVKLNAFQRVMRLWDAVHPYNAAQAFRLQLPLPTPPSVPGGGVIERLSTAWRATLSDMQIGRTVVRGEEYAHTAPDDSDDRANLQVIGDGVSLETHLSSEMNRRFDAIDNCPFRAFVIAEHDHHVLGVTYHHWAADSYSIRWLLREWFCRICDPNHRPNPAMIAQHGQWKHFGPAAAGWRLDDAVFGLLRYRTRFARVRKCNRPMGDCRVAVSLHQVPGEIVPILAARARQRGATMHDLLVAVVAQAVDPFGATPRTASHDELSLGTVVDLRSGGSARLNRQFGLFLGFTTTIVRSAHLEDFPKLLFTVANQNAWQKRTKAPQTSVLRMGAGLIEAKFYSPRRWAELYRERMPIAAGVSNVNMNRDWAMQYHPSLLTDYYRIAPPGPMLPLIVTPTTLGSRMNFLITRQVEQIDDKRLTLLAESVIHHLTELAADTTAWDSR